jgi:hypothetical protein
MTAAAKLSAEVPAGGRGGGASAAGFGGVDTTRLAVAGPAVCRLRAIVSARFSEQGTLAGCPAGNLQRGRRPRRGDHPFDGGWTKVGGRCAST